MKALSILVVAVAVLVSGCAGGGLYMGNDPILYDHTYNSPYGYSGGYSNSAPTVVRGGAKTAPNNDVVMEWAKSTPCVSGKKTATHGRSATSNTWGYGQHRMEETRTSEVAGSSCN